MSRYIFPALVLVLLLLFYLGLPDLSATPMYSLEGQRKHRRHSLDRADCLIMLCITQCTAHFSPDGRRRGRTHL